MAKKKVELLAPAGDYGCCMAAINAGADAVYLGGFKFGARAYANNFSHEDIKCALRTAHILKRKIYLTVNTLIKEDEIGELVPYVMPLYEEGLDGVIVHDIGAAKIIRENFPHLAMHASTQMSITGAYGAEFAKKLGICRVVPARELSLDEIRDIKEKTGLEIECFIHGAMCYSYSGQCLFSSILGGRSGNRGRCAGPCRLPYADEKGRQQYPLSLKDMYALADIPKLIEAGIDSFKIEGRMKSAEYAAGVTAVYRKYIDNFLTHPEREYRVSKEDEELLRGLYIRSDTCRGYYEKHNDKNMVTLKNPGYSGSSKEALDEIKKKYIDKKPVLLIKGKASIFAGRQAVFTLSAQDVEVSAYGEMVVAALNRPLAESDIAEKLSKLGGTCFELEELIVDTDNASFMAVKALNELRRKACEMLEPEILKKYKQNMHSNTYQRGDAEKIIAKECGSTNQQRAKGALAVLVTTPEQLGAALSFDEIRMLYIDADIFLYDNAFDLKERKDCDKQLQSPNRFILEKQDNCDKQYFLALPHILRKRSYKYLENYKVLLEGGMFSGVLIRNFEEYEWLESIGYSGQIIADYTIYAWNNASLDVCSRLFSRVARPLELNAKELAKLSNDEPSEILIYGRIPLMYSANCVRNTLDKCINTTRERNVTVQNDYIQNVYVQNVYVQNVYILTDRYKNTFPVTQNCLHCFNILYNTVPLSLHGQLDGILKGGYDALRLDFTLEDAQQTKKAIKYYIDRLNNVPADFALGDFTNGHYKRGVE